MTQTWFPPLQKWERWRCLQPMTIQKGCHYPRGLYMARGRPEDGAAQSARSVRKESHGRYPYGMGLEGYIGVCQVWEEESGRQRKKGLLKKDESFLVIDLGRVQRRKVASDESGKIV